MFFLKLKSSLGYIWYTLCCFSIEIVCHILNVGRIRYFDSTINDKSKDISIIFCLIIVAFTIVSSSISTICNLINGFTNSIENYSTNFNKYKKRFEHLPYLCLIDIHIAILILLPKLIIDTQLINAKIKDQGYVFESSLDFLIGNVMKRIKNKDDESIFVINGETYISCEILNLFLLLIRYYFNISNIFYKLNKCLSIILSIHSIISILFILFLFGTFEILFKQISFINNSINIYSYLFILSLIFSILFILLINYGLLHLGIVIYSQQRSQISNQLIRLSNLDDRYFVEKRLCHSFIYYLLFIILCVLIQFPLILFSFKVILSGLIDYLVIIYILFLFFFFFISILLFIFICYCSLSHWNFDSLQQYLSQVNQDNQSISSQLFHKSNINLEDNLFHIQTPHLLPTRSISSCGLTVIDYDYSPTNQRHHHHHHPTFQQTPGVATDTLLVMH